VKRVAKSLCAGLLIAGAPYLEHLYAQSRLTYPLVSPDSGHVALGLALRKLSVSGTFLQAPAHPDDETNSLFAYFGYGQGLRVIDLQNNRGDGGQNEIGPELFRDIAVLRTSELLAAHRIDGAEQYFTRAIDYGYSFDPQEVIAKWGRRDIVGDYVRLFRTLRPDVVVTMNIQGRGGDRAHEATTILVHEGYLAAGDPNQYPEQLAEGLRPWQPKKLYFAGGPSVVPPGGRGAAGATPEPAPKVKLTPVNTAAYDPLLGRTYQDIGNDARRAHKCQGMGSFLPAPNGATGPRGGGGGRGPAGYQLMETSLPGEKDKLEKSLFDGIDTSLTSIAQYAGPNPPAPLTFALAAITTDAHRAQMAFVSGDDTAAAEPVEAGLNAIRALRAQLPSFHLSESALYEIDFRLNTKERDYEDALVAAHGLTFGALADDGLVIAGQPIKLSLTAQNRGGSDVSISGVTVTGFDSPSACAPGPVKTNTIFTCNINAHIPAGAPPTTPYFDDNYWSHTENQAIQILRPGVPFGVPFAPSPFAVTFRLKIGDTEITRELPVEYRYVKDPFVGDKRMELTVAPAFSVSMAPSLMVIPAATASKRPLERELHVSVTNGTKGPAQVDVSLHLPPGWKAVPPTVPIRFAHEDEALSARFQITAPGHLRMGDYPLGAIVSSPSFPNQKFESGYQVIEYPHVERRQVMKPAETALKVVDVKTVPNLSVGYIVGAGDQVPAAIAQLGARVTLIDPEEMAWGNLSKYDAIVTGVRAYESRADLRAYNRRLLDYANRGGTVIVQYNKMEFNEAEYGPYPAKVSGNRIADETVPVKVLAPDDPVFNFPNKIGPASWAGWVQERGLYFLGEKDKRYVDLVSMTDSFKDNPGVKLGSLVEAKTGKGRWIYVGLALWRQLPAGTEGAYQLMANLISLRNAPAIKTERALALR
jgi:LmbE family N-acetylglucosaminyl deacetylase